MNRTEPIFYFDVGSPYAYLAAERVERVLGEGVDWQPVLLGGLFKLTGRSSWALGDYERRRRGMAEIERRAADYGLPPLRWPDPWPGNYLAAMRAATYAHGLGLTREFALAATRSAFTRGTDLGLIEPVLDAAAEVGIARDDLRAAIVEPEVKDALREATENAHERGVFGVPTIAIGDDLFWGDDRLEDAAALAASG